MTTEHLQNINAKALREGRDLNVDITAELLLRMAKETEAKNNAELDRKDQWTDRRQIRSATSNRVYTVARHKTKGFWGCSCPGWRARRTCKHVDAIEGKKQSKFTAGKYKTYEGAPGSPEDWARAVAPPAVEPPSTRRIKL
jgi:hypothetical protein